MLILFAVVLLLPTVVVSQCRTNVVVGPMTVLFNGKPQTLYLAQTGGVDGKMNVAADSLTMDWDTRGYLVNSCDNQFSADLMKASFLGVKAAFTTPFGGEGKRERDR